MAGVDVERVRAPRGRQWSFLIGGLLLGFASVLLALHLALSSWQIADFNAQLDGVERIVINRFQSSTRPWGDACGATTTTSE